VKPVVADEVYFIGAEALRNAVRHAGAQQITAEIRYENRQFRARIRDDGRGFDAQALRRAPPAGHFGLPGMCERAEIVGGSLDVWSKSGFGTLIELSIPAAIAYAAGPRPRSRAFSRLARPLSWLGRTRQRQTDERGIDAISATGNDTGTSGSVMSLASVSRPTAQHRHRLT
jgi:Histidine kinase-like ATPase domain